MGGWGGSGGWGGGVVGWRGGGECAGWRGGGECAGWGTGVCVWVLGCVRGGAGRPPSSPSMAHRSRGAGDTFQPAVCARAKQGPPDRGSCRAVGAPRLGGVGSTPNRPWRHRRRRAAAPSFWGVLASGARLTRLGGPRSAYRLASGTATAAPASRAWGAGRGKTFRIGGTRGSDPRVGPRAGLLPRWPTASLRLYHEIAKVVQSADKSFERLYLKNFVDS